MTPDDQDADHQISITTVDEYLAFEKKLEEARAWQERKKQEAKDKARAEGKAPTTVIGRIMEDHTGDRLPKYTEDERDQDKISRQLDFDTPNEVWNDSEKDIEVKKTMANEGTAPSEVEERQIKEILAGEAQEALIGPDKVTRVVSELALPFEYRAKYKCEVPLKTPEGSKKSVTAELTYEITGHAKTRTEAQNELTLADNALYNQLKDARKALQKLDED